MQPLKEEIAQANLKMEGWLFEPKFDGTSSVDGKIDGKVYIVNREGVHYEGRNNLPEIVEDLAKFPDNTVVQGELCFFNIQGEAEFRGSQVRCSTQHLDLVKVKQYPITLMAYTILMLNGENLEQKTELERKEILKKLIEEHDFKSIRYTEHVLNDGTEMYAKATEGIVAKKIDGRYIHTRSHGWLKKKKKQTETFNVIGWTLGQGKRSDKFGALVLTQDGKYVGNAGTCRRFNDADLIRIGKVLKASPVVPKTISPREVGEPYTAIATTLKAKVEFTRWTPDHHIREPIIIGIEGEEENSVSKENVDEPKQMTMDYLVFKGDIAF